MPVDLVQTLTQYVVVPEEQVPVVVHKVEAIHVLRTPVLVRGLLVPSQRQRPLAVRVGETPLVGVRVSGGGRAQLFGGRFVRICRQSWVIAI